MTIQQKIKLLGQSDMKYLAIAMQEAWDEGYAWGGLEAKGNGGAGGSGGTAPLVVRVGKYGQTISEEAYQLKRIADTLEMGEKI